MVCSPKTMTQQQWSAYKARILREAHQLQAATIRAAFSHLFAAAANLARRSRPQHRQQKREFEPNVTSRCGPPIGLQLDRHGDRSDDTAARGKTSNERTQVV